VVERPRLVEALTWLGWACLAGFAAVALGLLDQSLDDDDGWADRLQLVAYVATPANVALVVLAAGAALAAGAVRAGYASSDHHPQRTARLGWSVVVAGAVAAALQAIGIVAVAGDDYGSLVGRVLPFVGGAVMTAAAIAVALLSVRMTPPPPSHHSDRPHHARPINPFSQPPSSPPR